MSGHLSYFSKLDELKAASDEQLRKEISCLNPEIVTEYVFHLRAELANMKADKEVLIENIKCKYLSMVDNPFCALFFEDWGRVESIKV